jgi:hypothetical protein
MKKAYKVILLIVCCYIGLFFLTYFVFFSWSVPQISGFSEYGSLINWDLDQHGSHDYDGDGKYDFITYSGCAFLSSVDIDTIPKERQCTAANVRMISGSKELSKIGQKYIETEKYDLNWDTDIPVSHSYLAKYKDTNWRIYLNTSKGLQAIEIGKDGSLKAVDDIRFANRIDEVLYYISAWSMYIAFFTMPVAYVFGPLLTFGGESSEVGSLSSYIVILLVVLSLFVLAIVKSKTARKKKENQNYRK